MSDQVLNARCATYFEHFPVRKVWTSLTTRAYKTLVHSLVLERCWNYALQQFQQFQQPQSLMQETALFEAVRIPDMQLLYAQ